MIAVENRSVSDVFSLSQIPNYSKVSSIVNKYFLFHYNLVAISKEGTNKCAAVKADKKKSKQDFLNEYNSSPNLYQKACKTAASCCDKIRLLTEAEVGGLYVYLVKMVLSVSFLCIGLLLNILYLTRIIISK